MNLVFNKKIKKVKIPKNYEELESIFLKEFNEDKKKTFSFFYLSYIHNNDDFSKIINQIYKNNNIFIKEIFENEIIENIDNNYINEEDIYNKYGYLKKKRQKSEYEEIIKENEKLRELNNNLLEIINNLEINYKKEKEKNDNNNVQILKLQNELENKNKIINNYNIKNNSNFEIFPKTININNSNNYTFLNNNFIIFNSIYDILYLIYINSRNSIIAYNLVDNKIINEIKNAHLENILNFRHYLDEINKRDLIISVSDNNIILWNANNWECMLDINNIYKNGKIFSACFLNDNKNTYIISSNHNYKLSEPIKIFDFNGCEIKEINDSKKNTIFIDTYYDKSNLNTYIISANDGFIDLYNYKNNTIFNTYDYNYDINFIEEYYNLCCNTIINNNLDLGNKEVLIASCIDGYIRIWDFYSANFIKKIKCLNNISFTGICLWNSEYIISGCSDGSIKLIDLKNKAIISKYNYDIKNIKEIISVSKFIHPKFGQCLISQDSTGQIIILINNYN